MLHLYSKGFDSNLDFKVFFLLMQLIYLIYLKNIFSFLKITCSVRNIWLYNYITWLTYVFMNSICPCRTVMNDIVNYKQNPSSIILEYYIPNIIILVECNQPDI